MKLLSRLLVTLFLLFAASPALAQWQVNSHAIPIGKGAGVIGFGQAAAGASGTVFLGKGTTTDPAFVAMSGDCTIISTGVISCAKSNGVSMPASGTSGGVAYYSSTSAMASSALLAANQIVLGGGAGTAPFTLGSLGTTSTLLHGNAGGAPTFGAVVSADLSLTTTTCTNQFVTAISAAAAGTCTTDTLASAQHANQGTTTQVLHGNAAGNPSWGQVAIGADVSGMAAGVATFLATPSSANLISAVTDETGSGALVFGTTPTIATPVINGLATGTGVASAATASTIATRDANANLSGNNFLPGYATTATAAGTTTLTVASPELQYFTGATTQTVTLPVTSTLVLGQSWTIVNNSSGAVTVNSSGGNLVLTVAAGNTGYFTVILTSGTTAASWSKTYVSSGAGTGTVTSVTCGTGLTGGTITTTGTCDLTTPVTRANGGTQSTTGAFIKINVQTFTASGTYTPTTGMLYVEIDCVGGGGGSGGIAGNATFSQGSGGGGSGAHSYLFATAATIGASQTVTIGAAGTAGSAGANNGGAGGDTSLGTICIAKGGSGSLGVNLAIDNGAAGGTIAGGAGTIIQSGEPGWPGDIVTGSGANALSGQGGGGFFGGGGRGLACSGSAGSGTGSVATNYGGGAGGACAGTVTNQAGNTGFAGFVMVKEYLNQ